MHRTVRAALGAAVILLASGSATRAAELRPELQPFRPLLGKTWRGVFPASTKENPVVDVSRFEAALNGQAVRYIHSINDGEYGGETLIVWDKEQQGLVYYYFTTAGFYTTGSFHVEGNVFVSHEVVKGNAEGITEVKGNSQVLPDGRLHVKTQYLKNGQWVDGRDVHYSEDPRAEVRFKD